MKKVYLKPEVKAFEINTESALIATSGPGLKSSPLGDDEYYD